MEFDFKKSILELLDKGIQDGDKESLILLNKLQGEIEKIGDKKFAKEINELRSRKEMVKKSVKIKSTNQEKIFFPKNTKRTIDIIIKEDVWKKILFFGSPGTGKTAAVEYIAEKMGRHLLKMKLDRVLDSYLGNTLKNLTKIFIEAPKNSIIFLDEIDSLVIDRFATDDLGEIKRSTIMMLNLLDDLREDIIFICATNKIEDLDPAFIRRINKIVDFDNYSSEDYEVIINKYFDFFGKNELRLITCLIMDYEGKISPSKIEKWSKDLYYFKEEKDEFTEELMQIFGFKDRTSFFRTLKQKHKISFVDQEKIFKIPHYTIRRISISKYEN